VSPCASDCRFISSTVVSKACGAAQHDEQPPGDGDVCPDRLQIGIGADQLGNQLAQIHRLQQRSFAHRFAAVERVVGQAGRAD
jgi:hypothetical protein